MSDVELVPAGSQFPTLFSFFQLLTVLINSKSRRSIGKLLNYRNLAGVLLSTLFWKLDAAFNLRLQIRRLWEGYALIKEDDMAHRYLMTYLVKHPKFQDSRKNVEVTMMSLTGVKSRPGQPPYEGGRHAGPFLVPQQAPPKREEQKSEITEGEEAAGAKSPKVKKEKKKRTHAVLLKPAPSVTTHFVFQGTNFWIRRGERKDVPSGGRTQEELHLTYWAITHKPLLRLLDFAQDMYLASLKEAPKSVSIYRMDKSGCWRNPKVATVRRSDTLHLPNNVKEEIFADVKRFFSNKCVEKYAERCIPYRRGFLFYGPAGCGKSTLVNVLASELGESIYLIDLGSPTIDDDIFLQAMKSLPPRCIVLIEDIDVAFVKRKVVQASPSACEGEEKTKSKKSAVSFSAVLNALDGVDAQEGRLLCMTTNHIEMLDPALIRPGRIDRKFEIKHATSEQVKELFIRWFTPRSQASPSKEVQEQADAFAKSIPQDTLSVAALQGYLIRCDEDPQKAVQDVEAWINEQAAE